jgi:hypothetical protein
MRILGLVGSPADVADPGFPRASIVEGLRFTAQVAVPNVIQGLFRRRRTATVAAAKTNADGFAVGLIAGLKRSYGEGPLWIRVAKDEALLALGRDAIRHALEGAPDPYAADPEPKKSAMAKFQPDALTISRGAEWEDRRRFTEAVLETGQPAHRFASRFSEVASEEAHALPAEVDWERWNEAVRRVARRIILGDGAADDAELSRMLGELMDKANPPGRGDDELLTRYMERVRRYVEAAAPGSLVSLFADAPTTAETKPARQVTHWLFALGDTLAINAARCLAVLAVHQAERARAIEEWISGGASDDWQFNHFSRGLQGCPGVALSLLVGRTMLGALLREREVQLLAPRLDPGKPLPYSLDYFSLRFRAPSTDAV